MTPPLNTSKKRFAAFRRSRNETPPLPGTAPAPRRAEYSRRYLRLLRRHTAALAWLIAISVLGIAIDMVWPLMSAHLIDHVILSKELSVERKLSELHAKLPLGRIGRD